MKNIEKVEQFLKGTPVVYLTTVDGNRPKCRPIGLHMLIGENLYFVDLQVLYNISFAALEQANPNVELCVCKNCEFLRYYGKAVFETDDKLENTAIASAPFLAQIYNEATGKRLGIFHLENATAEFRTMTGIQESFSL